MGTYNLQGFSEIKPKINNSVGVISPVGELSTYASTFTKDLTKHENASWPNIAFSAFYSTDSDTGKQIVPTNFSNITIEVSDSIYAYCATFQGTITRLDILNHLASMFANRINNVVVGELITGAGITIIEWVSFSLVGAQANNVRTWFADSAFTSQYVPYEIIVIPPIDNLDDFFKPVEDVKVALAARTQTRTLELIDIAKDRHPETLIRGDEFTFSPATNPEYRPRISFTTIHYGIAGDSPDLVKQAIRDYCVENSSYPLTRWAEIFPDIFKTTEFIVLPRWDLVAIPNKTNQTGLNSPFINPDETMTVLQAFYPMLPQSHIKQNTKVATHPYMSVAMAIFGGVDNRDGKYKITDYFPDYICVGTNSPDFNRMARSTQEWSTMMNTLLMVAENPSKFPNLPHRVKRVKRGNVEYITQIMDNILYLVVTKNAFSTP
jgi:hypothetical protein